MKTPGLLPTWEAVHSFVFAGTATFTLKSVVTGVRFTYKVRVKKEDLERLQKHRELVARLRNPTEADLTDTDVVYFVNLLRGPDNEADFAYMGVLRKPGTFFRTGASVKVSRTAPAHKALVWFLDCMAHQRPVLLSKLEVWHEGACGRCGRKLTVPESIAAGLGPECAGRVA